MQDDCVRQLGVLVITPNAKLGRYLAYRLPGRWFEVFDVRPGPMTVEMIYTVSPHIAVLDRIDQRTTAAQLEIALLKKRRSRVQIILASAHSSAQEASLVEQGIFYYFAGRPRSELVRVVIAAARTLGCDLEGGANGDPSGREDLFS